MDAAAPLFDFSPQTWPIRILVTGWRDWPRQQAWVIHNALDTWTRRLRGKHERRPVIIVHGECPYGGADLHADGWARAQGPLIWPEPHPAQWKSLGKRAGMVRNQHMVNLGASVCLGFPGPLVDPAKPGGTRNCMGLARAADIEVEEVPWSEAFLAGPIS